MGLNRALTDEEKISNLFQELTDLLQSLNMKFSSNPLYEDNLKFSQNMLRRSRKAYEQLRSASENEDTPVLIYDAQTGDCRKATRLEAYKIVRDLNDVV